MASLTAKYNANSFSPTISAPLSCLRRLSMFLIVLCTSEASWKQNAQNRLNYNSILTLTKGWTKWRLFPFLSYFYFELLNYAAIKKCANSPTQKFLRFRHAFLPHNCWVVLRDKPKRSLVGEGTPTASNVPMEGSLRTVRKSRCHSFKLSNHL